MKFKSSNVEAETSQAIDKLKTLKAYILLECFKKNIIHKFIN